MLAAKDRVVLISGANRGIGLALANNLHAKGYRLSLGVRDATAMAKHVAAMDPARVHVAAYEAKDWASHEAWVAAAVARFGRIDALVNNAGIGVSMTIRTANEQALDDMWAVNCKAPINMIRCALPHLEASGSG